MRKNYLFQYKPPISRSQKRRARLAALGRPSLAPRQWRHIVAVVAGVVFQLPSISGRNQFPQAAKMLGKKQFAVEFALLVPKLHLDMAGVGIRGGCLWIRRLDVSKTPKLNIMNQ